MSRGTALPVRGVPEIWQLFLLIVRYKQYCITWSICFPKSERDKLKIIYIYYICSRNFLSSYFMVIANFAIWHMHMYSTSILKKSFLLSGTHHYNLSICNGNKLWLLCYPVCPDGFLWCSQSRKCISKAAYCHGLQPCGSDLGHVNCSTFVHRWIHNYMCTLHSVTLNIDVHFYRYS